MRTYLPLAIIFSSIFCAYPQTQPQVRPRYVGKTTQDLPKRLHNNVTYNADIPPGASLPVPIPDSVLVRILLHRLIWLDNQVDVHLTLKEEWRDTRIIALLSNATDTYSLAIPDGVRIWEPDTYFSNGEETPLGNRKKTIIETSGYVRTNKMRSVKVPIKDESRFPFINRKKFVLRLSSYKYPRSNVLYVWTPTLPAVETTEQLRHSRYQFENFTQQECISSAANVSSDAHSCVEVTLTFIGPTKQGIVKVFFPSLLLVFASWLHFWIHGSWSVPRTLSAAVPFFLFASLLVFCPYLYEEYSRGIREWFVTCLLFTFASFVEYFLVICCGIKRTIRYTNGVLEGEVSATAKEVPEARLEARPIVVRSESSVDVISRLLFPLIFVIFLAIYLLVQLL